MKTIKAIQTSYRGYSFRSRLEARFAVLFDAMGLDWDYEPEGFELPSGWYLPDFFVRYPPESIQAKRHPGAGYWVEIKGAPPTEREVELCIELSEMTKHKTWIYYNGLGREARAFEAYRKKELNLPECARQFLEFGASIIRSYDAGEVWGSAPICCCQSEDRSTIFDEALAIARSARFEHGETPNV